MKILQRSSKIFRRLRAYYAISNGMNGALRIMSFSWILSVEPVKTQYAKSALVLISGQQSKNLLVLQKICSLSYKKNLFWFLSHQIQSQFSFVTTRRKTSLKYASVRMATTLKINPNTFLSFQQTFGWMPNTSITMSPDQNGLRSSGRSSIGSRLKKDWLQVAMGVNND